MRFASIPGLSTVKQRLIRAVKNHKIAHAQLFFGPEGALTLPMALAYTTYLHCQDKQEGDACGLCAACHKSKKYIHPDTCFIFPISNIKNSNDEDRLRTDMLKLWRAFLLEHPFGKPDDWINYYGGENKHALISRDQSRVIIKTLSLKPFESAHKVVIVWQLERMHPTASNSILKTLEEPPPNTSFLLVSNEAEKLLPTIQSRIQTVQTPLLSDEDMSLFLQREKHIGAQQIKTILQLANGDLNRALQLAESSHNLNQHQFADWMRACFKRDYKKLVDMAEEFHKSDKIKQQNMLRYSTSMLREALLCMADATSISRIEDGDAQFIRNFSNVLDVSKIEKFSETLFSASRYLGQNGSAKMIFLSISLQCATILRSTRP